MTSAAMWAAARIATRRRLATFLSSITTTTTTSSSSSSLSLLRCHRHHIPRHFSNNNNNNQNDWLYPLPQLTGACKCGAVGWKATGSSALNFICHCSVCRKATGAPSTAAAGFKHDQIEWRNREQLETRTPPGSRNDRYYCKSCGTYVAENALRPLGVYALPLTAAVDGVDDCYRPNHHIFYANRVEDVDDRIPKWETLPEGTPSPSSSASTSSTPTSSSSSSPSSQYSSSLGRLRKDVLPMSPTRAPEPLEYVFTESDPSPNHVTRIDAAKIDERVDRKYYPSPSAFVAPSKPEYDVIIVGGGHNGLVASAYLAQAGQKVLVLERRHLIGGAAVTEEMIPGFKFSRASYLAGLMRPDIIRELGLEQHGFKYLTRNPSSFTPTLESSSYGGKYLMLGADSDANHRSISQFSARDADAFIEYEGFLDTVREMIQPLLDGPPPNPIHGRRRERMMAVRNISKLVAFGVKHSSILVPFYELFTAPATHILDRYFESEILKTTLATDAVIGAMAAPSSAGSAYVLLHHVMGEAAGKKGVWAYVEGGMGAISDSIAAVARQRGVEITCNATVKRILHKDGSACGVEMKDGTKLHARTIISNATPYHTMLELFPGLSRDSGAPETEVSPLPREFQHHIRYADYSCGAFKINCAVDKLPNFSCLPTINNTPNASHMGTVHFESRMEELEHAYREASMGYPASRPVVEMTIPSSVDKTISPPGQHVVQLFVQFAPYSLDPHVGSWADPAFKQSFVDRCFGVVDKFAPGFSQSVIGVDALSPLDLERVFGLHKGNIHHGALSLHQLGYARPMSGYSSYRMPLRGLYICGAGAHPGGGVMGVAGRNAANIVISDLGL